MVIIFESSINNKNNFSSVREKKLAFSKPIKNLTLAKRNGGGRSSLNGRITVRHRGKAHRRRYRMVDFYRYHKDNSPCVVLRIERDPNRTANIALLVSKNGVLSYIIAAHRLEIGSVVELERADDKKVIPYQFSSIYSLRRLPVGSRLHNLQFFPNHEFKLARAAGAAVQLLKHDNRGTILRLPSSEIRYFSSSSLATFGIVSNPQWKWNNKLYKAGQNRWKGRRPSVRGVAMNPIDHPHGGGQGKTSGGRPSVTPWGWLTKGYRTRKKKGSSSKIVRRRLIKHKKFK